MMGHGWNERDMWVEQVKGAVVILVLFLFGYGLYCLIKADEASSLQRDLAVVGPCLADGKIVKIVDTDYARHGTKEANYVTCRVVTCETKVGHRFNIVQEVRPDLIPLAGEEWEVFVEQNNSSAKVRFLRRVKRE